MVLSNEPLDLIAKEIDVALRVGNLPDSNLVARKLSVFRTQIYASPAYIERHGEPLHPDDLQHHRALAMQKARHNGNYLWTLNDGKREADFIIDPIIVANDPAALRGALLCGEGLMMVSEVMIKAYAEQGLVQRVLGGWRGPDYDFSAVFPRGQVQSPKVRAFVDFLVERLNFDADYMQVLCEDSERCQHLAQAAAAAEAAAVSELERVVPKRPSRPKPAPTKEIPA
jgi:DNA-binding transcriptional LysR family regulator